MTTQMDLGDRYGSLIFAGHIFPDKYGRIHGTFRCDCGKAVRKAIGRVITGRTPFHCGCQTDRGKSRTHGMRGSPEYSSWQAMKNRCLSPNSKDYPRWGGAGITVCDEWIASFEAFYAHVGPRPRGTSLDRIDGNRGYEPGNVRWASRREQQRNKQTSCDWYIKGAIFPTAQEAADFYGISKHSIWRWVRGSYDNRRKSFTPPREDCYAIPRY